MASIVGIIHMTRHKIYYKTTRKDIICDIGTCYYMTYIAGQ